jgi:predicted nucleic acid-binding protein
VILVDTSVWVDHLRRGDSVLVRHLNDGEVFCHPFVVGELACGNLKRRDEILSLLAAMPSATIATHEEALLLSTEQRLFGRGLGWVDVHLLASSLLSRSTLWTRAKALKTAAEGLKVGYDITR